MFPSIFHTKLGDNMFGSVCLSICITVLSRLNHLTYDPELKFGVPWNRDCSYGEMSGLKRLVFGQFCDVLASSKLTPVYRSIYSPDLCRSQVGNKFV